VINLYPSTPAKLYTVTNNEYGRQTVDKSLAIEIFIQEANQWTRGGNVQTLDADSIAAITPQDYSDLTGQVNGRLEGLYLHVEPFSDYSWYRIETVSVGRDLLLGNSITHYELQLSRSTKPAGVA
jgi:hypothetical protein